MARPAWLGVEGTSGPWANVSPYKQGLSLLLAVEGLLILQVYGRQFIAILILVSANYFNVPFCKTRSFLVSYS